MNSHASWHQSVIHWAFWTLYDEQHPSGSMLSMTLLWRREADALQSGISRLTVIRY